MLSAARLNAISVPGSVKAATGSESVVEGVEILLAEDRGALSRIRALGMPLGIGSGSRAPWVQRIEAHGLGR